MYARNEEKLTHKVFARVSKRKYDELQEMLSQSRCRTLGELVRDILTEKKIVVESYDATQDKVMEVLLQIHKEHKRIGVNINQVVRRIHDNKIPAVQAELVLELTRLHQQADLKISALLTAVSKLSDKWLPE